MNKTTISAADFRQMLQNAAASLSNHCDEVNDLNVFPVPDGDTGQNMLLTLQGGVSAHTDDLSSLAQQVSRGMLLSARGNSGVILSQLFKGLSLGLQHETADAAELSEAFLRATEQAYRAVHTPTEGTILTVAREAGEYASACLTPDSTALSFLQDYLYQAERTLERTPELLPVLKQAGVVDSGGMGYIYILRGMVQALCGERLQQVTPLVAVAAHDPSAFTADSVLDYGYCTEFILQLQNSKVQPESFDPTVVTDFLNTVGDSIVVVKDADVLKVHVHTKAPGKVLDFCQQFGEFVTFKMENMSVQHSQVLERKHLSGRVHKPIGVVAVAAGEKLSALFTQMGTDIVIPGGQSMNPSAQEFLDAFAQLDCEDIVVLPNNSNIFMAAEQAASSYSQASVHVLPSKSLAQGYSALTMLDTANSAIDEVLDTLRETIAHVITGEVTYAVRDSVFGEMQIHLGDTLALLDGKPVSASSDRMTAIFAMLDAVDDLSDREVITILCGEGATEEEAAQIRAYMAQRCPDTEVGIIEAGQPVYRYLMAIE